MQANSNFALHFFLFIILRAEQWQFLDLFENRLSPIRKLKAITLLVGDIGKILGKQFPNQEGNHKKMKLDHLIKHTTDNFWLDSTANHKATIPGLTQKKITLGSSTISIFDFELCDSRIAIIHRTKIKTNRFVKGIG